MTAPAWGIDRVYLYQLLDGKIDPRGNNPQLHFGLFNADGSPKAAAKALQSLFAILREDNPRAVGDEKPTPRRSNRCASDDQRLAAEPFVWPPLPGALERDAGMGQPDNVATECRADNVTVTLPYALPVASFDVIEGGRKVDLGISKRVGVPIGAHPVILSLG